MPKRFKDRIDFLPSLLKAARDRINDTDQEILSDSTLDTLAFAYMNNKGSLPPLNRVTNKTIARSTNERNYLKDFKYAVHSLNAKINSAETFARLNAKDVFATLYEIQRQVYKLDVEVGEAEIKMINGFSKVHLNSFVRQMDSQLQYEDKSWITDFKTSFSYPEKYLLHLIPSSGITLPRKYEVTVPIIDAYIVDEYTDVGDTLTPVISTSPRNVFLDNKIFKHILIRKGFDETSRKYKSKTIYDNYPYSATSQMGIELVLPNVCMINFLKVNPVNASAFSIKEISYLNEAGEQVNIVAQKIDSDLFATYLFEPIYTKNLRVVFEQASTVAKTTSIIGDMEMLALSDMLEGAGFSAEVNADTQEISGRWYDFSIKDIEVGEIGYENKGIYRSKPVKISGPLGFEINRFVESITPEELFSEYYKTITLPEGKALTEGYVGVRLSNAQEGTVVDSIVPVADSYPTQMEFLDFIHTDARVKLFPDLEWHLNDNCVDQATIEQVCLSLDEVIPDEGVNNPQDTIPGGGMPEQSDDSYIELAEEANSSIGTRRDVNVIDTSGVDREVNTSCLLEGEEVIVSYNGKSKPIEDFCIGDTVYTYDYRRKAYGEYVVTATMQGVSSGWLEIYFEGIDDPLKCSLSHHMIDGDFEQIPAFLMDEGDLVWYVTPSFGLEIVEITEIIYHDEEVEVYNIEVEDSHTYVTKNGILQHNKTYSGGGTGGPDITIVDDPLDFETGKFETGDDTEISTGADASEVQTVSLDRSNSTGWRKNFTVPRLRNLPVPNRVGTTTASEDGLSYAIGESFDGLSAEQKQTIINSPSAINKALNLNKRLMIGSDGATSGYTKVTPLHINADNLNLVDRAYWKDRLVAVDVSLKSSTSSKQEYDVQISKPRKNLSRRPLRELSTKDRLEVKRLARVQELASQVRDIVPSRDVGTKQMFKSLKDSSVLDTINTFVNSVMSPKVGYKVNARGALEIGLVDDLGRDEKLYSRTYAAIKKQESFALNKDNVPWQTFTIMDIGTASEEWSSMAEIEVPTVTDALNQISDCMDFVSFTTKNPHGLKEGDMVTLTSHDSRFSGIHIVALVEDDYTFYIALESFTGLINVFGISFSDTNGVTWTAVTSEIGPASRQVIDVSSIADESAADPITELVNQIRNSLALSHYEAGLDVTQVVQDTAEPNKFTIEVSPHPTDPARAPTEVVGSIVDNGLISFTNWNFDGTVWSCTGTINSIDELYSVDFALTQLELYDLQNTQICIWNQDVEDPIELYEDERLLKIGVDYSISLDDKSTWYDYWIMPGEESYSYLNKRAKAGRFYVRVHNRKAHAIYWIKYRVKKNQALSSCEKVRLRNGRITFDRKLKDTFGTLQTVFIFRTNSTNPYITPILREYSLRIQERDDTKAVKSNLSNKEVFTRSIGSKRNVS